jgi:TP901 family phage tail tape measure protein
LGITIGQLTAIITADSTEFETRMQRVSNILNQTKDDADRSMKAIGSAMLGLGVTISAALTAPLAKVGQEVVETGAKFQATMNMLGAVTGATSNELIRMRDLAIQLGADLSLPATSAQDAANAMLVLSKANLSVSDTMAAAKGTLQLAAAAHIDEAQAAQITTDALLAFHLAGEKATQVADLLANASVHTKSNVTDLGAALRNSGAQFQAAKIPIEDLVTSIGLMAAAGIRGGQAGTDLKVMLQRLTAPTKEAAESMQRLGIHIFDAHGAILPLRDIIGQFTQKMSALTDASKLHDQTTIKND